MLTGEEQAEQERQQRYHTVRAMLADGVPVAMVTKYTGFSAEEIEAITTET
ncbi:hypothetical protein QUF63_03360 [Anaerolineales bacterium HSG25]|nr:hypothetical protein [Anaerolineales bacterium HSG25]